MSATGQIDVKKGMVAGAGGNIKNWIGATLKDSLETEYGLDVTVANDANCAAYAEQWIGNATGHKNVIMITIGTGVGGGIIVNNQLLSGASGYAGEIGHFSIDYKGEECTCGNRGCYERYASMSALVRKVTNHAERLGIKNHNVINGKWIFDSIEEGNPALQELVDQWIDRIVDGLV